MAGASTETTWIGVAKETFERSMLPWVGRSRQKWLLAWAKPHPVDSGQMLIPGHIFDVYQARNALEPLTWQQLRTMRYPKLPDTE